MDAGNRRLRRGPRLFGCDGGARLFGSREGCSRVTLTDPPSAQRFSPESALRCGDIDLTRAGRRRPPPMGPSGPIRDHLDVALSTPSLVAEEGVASAPPAGFARRLARQAGATGVLPGVDHTAGMSGAELVGSPGVVAADAALAHRRWLSGFGAGPALGGHRLRPGWPAGWSAWSSAPVGTRGRRPRGGGRWGTGPPRTTRTNPRRWGGSRRARCRRRRG